MNKNRDIPTGTRRDAGQDPARASRPLSARSLALSALLGTHPPVLAVRPIVALGELFGIAGGTMRTALSRMVEAGELEVDDSRYRLAGPLLVRQIAQDLGRRPPGSQWSGRWHTAIAIDERRSMTDRRRFRTTMTGHRFGELRPDVWMRPANLPAPEPGPGWTIVTGELTGDVAPTLAGRLWDLAAITAAARSLHHELDRLRLSLDWADPASIPPIFTAAAAVVRLLRSEPMLPTQLVGDDWAVGPLRATYDDVERDLQAALRAYFRMHA